ncbi:MAG: YlmH/Sll1252 family protein [Turicibacter sp.]|nr:YlmH/Sll1252 family protein [Turicibacter sp.]
MVEKELAFTKRIKDLLATTAFTSKVKVIDFLNVSEQDVLEKMTAKQTDVSVVFGGGFEGAERNRAIIFPSFMVADERAVNVSLFRIEVIGSGEINHSQVLGSLMGLNIDRSVIGDIVVDETGTFFASCREFDRFLMENFTKVGRHDIRLEVIQESVVREQQFEEVEIIVSSMRLDVVVKALIQASRGKAEEYLDAGFVRLNHTVDKKPSRTCDVGDILSIRRHGRFKISEMKKTTKSGKFVLVVRKSV